MSPRATPSDYMAHGAAGKVTVGAEFVGHFVPTDEGTYTTEDYVAVEVGLYGAPPEHVAISFDQFGLRVNDRKQPVPGQPFGVIFHSLKDPNWSPPESEESKQSKTSIGTGGQQNEPKAPVHMPLPLQRAMQQHVEKVVLPDGDRPLPQAGLLFFPYHGKETAIHSVELIYTGPTGTVTLNLQP
ncbi:MAG TPA: hypothetical protein VMT86_22615 [Bryobacteraceae bacterium]|nr:hypothetical protein [Bryobacteraceae bacterium]